MTLALRQLLAWAFLALTLVSLALALVIGGLRVGKAALLHSEYRK